jgi:pilus assembly protein Flp/PilA
MLTQIIRLLKEEEGATAVEYGLMVALIAAVIVGSVTALGTNIDNKFNSVATSIANAS